MDAKFNRRFNHVPKTEGIFITRLNMGVTRGVILICERAQSRGDGDAASQLFSVRRGGNECDDAAGGSNQ